MIKSVKIRATTTRLALAIVGSMAIHAMVMSSARLDLAAPPQPRAPLEARLAPAPPPAVKPVAAPPVKKRRPGTRKAAAKAPPPPIPVATSPVPLYAPPEWEVEAYAAPAPEEAPVVDAAPPERVALAPESVTEVPVNPLPRRGRIEYSVVYGGGDGLPVGKAVHSWEMEEGHYLLASDAETTGLVDFFRPQRLRYISEGKVTQRGLVPESFFIARTRKGKTEVARALFDWDKGQILYGYAHDRKIAALTEGAQDVMSLAYHFALAPPNPGRFEIPVTTGKGFDSYGVEVFPEEIIDTPLGQMRTLPIKQIARPGKEHFEMWLAVQYNYLPVQIRHFDRKGDYSGEQIAIEIRVGEDGEMARR